MAAGGLTSRELCRESTALSGSSSCLAAGVPEGQAGSNGAGGSGGSFAALVGLSSLRSTTRRAWGPSSSRSKLLGLGGGELPGSARAPCSLLSPVPQSPAKRRRSPSDGRMVVLRQFGLLLWKNYILQVGWHGAPGGTLPLSLPDVVTSELSWRPGSCASVSGTDGQGSTPVCLCPHPLMPMLQHYPRF